MSIIHFNSCLAGHMEQFVNFKRIEGYDYTCRAQRLGYFDRFLCQEHLQQPRLTQELLGLYIAQTKPRTPDARLNRLSVVRVFSRFLHAIDPHSVVLEHIPVKRPSLPRFYLYSQAEINALLTASLQLTPRASLRPHCYHMLIGLMAVTGLRIGEALALDLRDLDHESGRLFVRRGKFGKERYVAVHSSTVERLVAYLRIRKRYGPDTVSSPLFLDRANKRLRYDTVRSSFATLRRRTQVGCTAAKLPRLHDLRHTYACNCVQKWRSEGANVNAKLPLLVTALGHTKIEHTQVYLHVTMEQLVEATELLRARLNRIAKGN